MHIVRPASEIAFLCERMCNRARIIAATHLEFLYRHGDRLLDRRSCDRRYNREASLNDDVYTLKKL